ncbi:MAG: hypothetical protein H6737_14980 [Alphaproteobacteria bacterium]|nr:hypothetical protein [Alphaproteobacteria bacterium]
MSQLDIVGTLYNHAAAPHPDERIALAESEGPFILADAKDAPRWLGLDYGGRWKTWVLGPLASLPMIPWPKFDRFHRHKHEAEGAYVALRGAIETCMVGAPIIEKPGAGESPEARYAGVYPQESDGEANPIGFLMMDECNDYDFAVHMTKGMACLRGGNYDGPRMVSYRPPPAACTVATKKGINDRIDHIVLVFHPGPDDQREFIRDGLRGAGPDGNHVDVKIDCMSGVIVAFWSRLSGRDMLGHYDDPAMGLCNDGLVKAGGAMAIPSGSRASRPARPGRARGRSS